MVRPDHKKKVKYNGRVKERKHFHQSQYYNAPDPSELPTPSIQCIGIINSNSFSKRKTNKNPPPGFEPMPERNYWKNNSNKNYLPRRPPPGFEPGPEPNYGKKNPNKPIEFIRGFKPIKEKTPSGSKQTEIEDKKLTPKKWMQGMIKKNQFSRKLLDEFEKFISKEKSSLSKKNKIKITSDEFFQYYNWFIRSQEFKTFKKDEAIKLIQRNFRSYLNKRYFRDYLKRIKNLIKLIRFKVTETLNEEGFKGPEKIMEKMIQELKE